METTVYNKAKVRALLFDKALIAILAKYLNYKNVFSTENAMKFLKYIKINNHTIKLEGGNQPLFGSIYSLESIKLETFKTYIKINLANNFI